MFTKEMFITPFVDLVKGIAEVLPKFMIALIIFVVGWLFAKLVYKAIVNLVRSLRVDEALRPLAGTFERAGYKLNVGKIIGFLLKWFIVIGSLVVALEVMGLSGVAGLVKSIVVVRIPQVIVAIVILLAGLTLADFTKNIVKGSTAMLNVKSAGFLANLAKIAVIVFTTLTALNIIGFNSEIINVIFMGVVAMFALAGGLAFGLGGQRAAAQAIEDVKASMYK